MKEIRDDCIGCPSGIGCMGLGCPYKNAEYTVCDDCGDDAYYNVDGAELCEDCTDKLIDSAFDELNLYEKIECAYGEYERIDKCSTCGKTSVYYIDGETYCEECAEKQARAMFGELSLKEKAEYLGIDLKDVD